MNQDIQYLDGRTGQLMVWTAVQDALPDDDILVLLAMVDSEVWPGVRDGETWRYVDAMPIASERVTHWMHMPAAPTGAAHAA
jgi:hypothetical protein